MIHIRQKKYIADLFVLLFGVLVLFIIPSEINSVPGDTTGPRFFPYLLAGVIVLLSVAQFVGSLIKKEDVDPVEEVEGRGEFSNLRVVLVIGCAFLWIVVIPTLGLTIPTFLVALLSMWILGERRIVPLVSIPVILSIIIYIVFVVILDVRFPDGLFY